MAITAAELIARISVQGMSQFNNDMLRAEASFRSLNATVNNVMRSIQMAMAAGATAFTLFTGTAIDEAAKIERLTATFGALGHSMDAGRAKMASLREYAQHSINTFDDLATAAKTLEAAGLNSDRFVKMMDIMGGVLHPGAEGINEMASALARIASGGNFGQAMRSLRGAGIGMGDLRAQGIQVTGGNRIVATSEQMLAALENIFQKKFGDMGSYLEKTMSVRFSNLHDAWNRLLASWGEAFFPIITSITDKLTPFLNFLSKSGEIEAIGAKFAGLFTGMKDGGWLRVLMFGVAVLEGLPDILRTVWDYVKGFMSGFGNMLVGIIDIVVEGIGRMMEALHEMAPLIQMMGDAARVIGGALNHFNFRGPGDQPIIRDGFPGLNFGGGGGPDEMRNKFAAFGAGGNAAASAFGGSGRGRTAVEDFFGQLPRVGNIFQGASRRTDELMAQFERFLREPKPGDIDRSKLPMFNANHEGNDILNAIKENTARMAAQMEPFKRYALGGGDRAKIGLTSSELYGNSSISRMRVETGRAANAMHHAVNELVGDYHQSFRRAMEH